MTFSVFSRPSAPALAPRLLISLMLGGIALAVCVVGLLSILILNAIREIRQPPPIAYDQFEYQPEQALLCPGIDKDTGVQTTLNYTPTLTVNETGRVSAFRTFWKRHTKQPGGNAAVDVHGKVVDPIFEMRNFPRSLKGMPRSNPVRVPLPNLPPGEYWLLVTTVGVESGQADYQVPFTIPEDCTAYIAPLNFKSSPTPYAVVVTEPYAWLGLRRPSCRPGTPCDPS